MAKFLTTTSISYVLKDIIKKSKKLHSRKLLPEVERLYQRDVAL
jgi:hypothetical protein